MKAYVMMAAWSFLLMSCGKEKTLQGDNFVDVNVQYVQKEDAAAMLGKEDSGTERWTQFDIDSRLGKQGGTKEELLDMVVQQVCDWTQSEQLFMDSVVEDVNAIICKDSLRLPLPEHVRLLKTTMKEEGGAGGYTRDNYIVLFDRIGAVSKQSASSLLAHEMFHVLTRNNPEFREKMYSLIGFKMLAEEVKLPDNFAQRLITNPDILRRDSYATFLINGKETDCTMFIYASKPYEGGDFFSYIKIGLVEIDRNTCSAVTKNGQVVLHELDEATDFYDKVGRNTNYVFDPEEILAENFSLMIAGGKTLNTPELVEKMRSVCQGK